MTTLPDIDGTGDERRMLTEFLAYFRAVLLRKVEGLDTAAARTRLAPSELDLLGLTRHMAEVERYWFRTVVASESTDGIYDADASAPDAGDGEWRPGAGATIEQAVADLRAEIARADEIVAAAPSLDVVVERPAREPLSLRWILVHMIEEYARHCGHADLLREAVDGSTGD